MNTKKTTKEILEEQKKLAEKNKLIEQRRAARIKALEKRAATEDRKERTHMLIVLGATISELFGQSYLEHNEIDQLKNCIKGILDRGYQIIKPRKPEVDETPKEEPAVEKTSQPAAEEQHSEDDDWCQMDNDI